jgi:prolyl-tRNA editing enzyme YbaK/EbsC (Cys-tRNA(Pro) deacylase)
MVEAMTPAPVSLKIHELRARVEALERKRFHPTNASYHNEHIAVDASMRRARYSVETTTILHYSACWKFVPENYYDTSLEQRAKFLNAPSIHYLCKSLLLENRKAPEDTAVTTAPDPTNPRFLLVVLQYASVLDVKKLTNAIRALRKDVQQRLDDTQFDLRIASEYDNERITGYAHNSVTPFGMICQRLCSTKQENNNSIYGVPIVLSDALVPLQFFWMGGGHVQLKLGMSLSDFCYAFDPIIADISRPRTTTEELTANEL